MAETLDGNPLEEQTIGPSRLYGPLYVIPSDTQQISCRLHVPQAQLESPDTVHTSGIELQDAETGNWITLFSVEDQGYSPHVNTKGQPIDFMGGAGGNVEDLWGRTVRPFVDNPIDELTTTLEIWREAVDG